MLTYLSFANNGDGPISPDRTLTANPRIYGCAKDIVEVKSNTAYQGNGWAKHNHNPKCSPTLGTSQSPMMESVSWRPKRETCMGKAHFVNNNSNHYYYYYVKRHQLTGVLLPTHFISRIIDWHIFRDQRFSLCLIRCLLFRVVFPGVPNHNGLCL